MNKKESIIRTPELALFGRVFWENFCVRLDEEVSELMKDPNISLMAAKFSKSMFQLMVKKSEKRIKKLKGVNVYEIKA